MTIRRFAATSLLVCAVALQSACARNVDNAEHVEEIRAVVSRTPSWVDTSSLGKRLWKIERAFYEARGYRPVWVDGVETTPQWKDLVQQLKYSAAHGLEPDAYGVAEFEALRAQSQDRWHGTRFPEERVPELDAKMTYAYLRYAADLLGWTRSPGDVHRNWLTDSKEEDLAARLNDAIASSRVRDSLEELAPTHPQYKGLQAALARELQARSGSQEEGRQGLPADRGLAADRAERLRMNMERWRWAPRDLGDRYVLINVPAYMMQVVENDVPALAMRVIVGEPKNQTPLFSDEMTYVVFSPYWNIPPGILRDETLPRVARDPDFLRRNNIEVVGTSGEEAFDPLSIDWSDPEATRGLRFRQRPGADNALGLVKFIFPNHFNVYLHDTPGDRLFNKEKRSLSHGCIRIEDPVALARYVLRDQPEWTESRIVDAMTARREQTVKLATKLPVHIGYWTAWVEPDGKTVTYTDDPYGLDPQHARLRGVRLADASRRDATSRPQGRS
jgi:murein L,D-transpeptidase YcbB/YkuD